MKLQEVLDQQLDEVSKATLAASVIGATAGIWGADHVKNSLTQDTRPAIVRPQHQPQKPELGDVNPSMQMMFTPQSRALIDRITDKYSVDEELAKRIVFLAHKYESPIFPKAKDILSIVGIESSFDPAAKSGLKRDPALGLMQVRPGVWKIDPSELADIEAQIKYGAQILRWYFKKLRNREAAVQAYNIGLTDFNSGAQAPEYLQKYNNERQLYAGI